MTIPSEPMRACTDAHGTCIHMIRVWPHKRPTPLKMGCPPPPRTPEGEHNKHHARSQSARRLHTPGSTAGQMCTSLGQGHDNTVPKPKGSHATAARKIGTAVNSNGAAQNHRIGCRVARNTSEGSQPPHDSAAHQARNAAAYATTGAQRAGSDMKERQGKAPR